VATFGLVHGGGHGAWQWGQLVAQLDAHGHRSVCVDLPIADPALGAIDYAAIAAAAFSDQNDLVVVGHSLGGYLIPFVTELISVRTLVFLGGAIQPNAFPGLPPAEEMLLIPPEQMGMDDDGLIRISPPAAERYFYHDLSPSMSRWAIPQLRPQSARAVVPERLPKLDSAAALAYVVCADDRALSPDWGRAAARDALHVEPYEIPGSHSPFLTRPAELANLLDAIAR
jgi:pimeloyl-ACP methyl ester carboxylesterase